MVILLSVTESENQIVSGFPEYVSLTTNVASTIFYTLDGSEPDSNSQMYVDKIIIPTTGLTTTLKAVAISGVFSSAVFEEVYFTNHSLLGKTRHIGDEGINILPPGETIVDNLSYDEDGNVAQATTIQFIDLDLVGSTSNEIGEPISKDTTIDFIKFSIKQPLPNTQVAISSPNDNINFNPRASCIIIDGSTPEALANQVVKIINRPHGTMDLVGQSRNISREDEQIRSSNFVRSMINPYTGKITFYYREGRENRWIKSTQQVEEGKGLNIASTETGASGFVFRWVENRHLSVIH